MIPSKQKTLGELVDALIGYYEVAGLVEASNVPQANWHQNAHTRRIANNGDVVVVGAKDRSGRLDRCIVIGRFRDRAHRVDAVVLEDWGGLSVRNGYIQRSARLPEFLQPERFLTWFAAQQPKLLASNNPL